MLPACFVCVMPTTAAEKILDICLHFLLVKETFRIV